MVQRKHNRSSFSRIDQSNVEWFSVNTRSAAFREIDQSNVEWFSVQTSGVAFREIGLKANYHIRCLSSVHTRDPQEGWC